MVVTGQAEGRGAARRQAILDAALACFTERGYDATRIEQICAASGASVGSIYHFYGSKEGIAVALYVEGVRQLAGAFLAREARGPSAGSGTASARARDEAGARDRPEKMIRAWIGATIDWALANPRWFRYLVDMRKLGPIAAADIEVQGMFRELLASEQERLRPFVERGEIARLPLYLYRPIVLGPAQELLLQWLSGLSDIDFADAKRRLGDAAWRALDPGKRARAAVSGAKGEKSKSRSKSLSKTDKQRKR